MTKFSDIYGRLNPTPVTVDTILDFEDVTTHELECLVRFYNNSRVALPEKDSIKLKLLKEELEKRGTKAS